MKNKYFIVILTCFCLTKTMSRQSITVDYNIAFNYNLVDSTGIKTFKNNNKNATKALKQIEKVVSLFETMTMTLQANKNKAVYFGNSGVNNDADPNDYKMAKTLIGDKDRFYYDLEKQTSYKWFNFQGENFIIKDSIKISDWKITNKSKLINNYNCYLATTNYTAYYKSGLKTHIVSAWFTPLIPFKFGPKGFGGLPGLILQLNFITLVFSASNIKFKKEEIEIEALPKGKHITIKILNDYISKARQNRDSSYKK